MPDLRHDAFVSILKYAFRSELPDACMKALLVDDHALIRDALRAVLVELKPDVLVEEASNGESALRLAQEHPDLDLVLLDLNLPDGDGLAVLNTLRRRRSNAAVVILSAFNDREHVVTALRAGASGFIPKSAKREVMLSALNLVFSGGIYIPPEVLPLDINAHESPALPAQPRAPALPVDLGLTERQLEVLALMMQGKSNKAICRALDLAEPTVKSYVTSILRALKATNRTEAVIAAGSLGWKPGSAWNGKQTPEST